MIEKLEQEAWSYALFEDGEALILTVVCGTIGVYERTLVLTDEEAASYRARGREVVARLADEIRQREGRFEERFVKLRLPE